MARRNEELDAALDELRKFGVTEVEFRKGRRTHIKILFRYGGNKRMVVVSSSGSDRRGILNARTHVRRQMNEAHQSRVKDNG